LNRMLRKVTPSIPLNPADRNAGALYYMHVNWLAPIDGRTVLGLKGSQIEALIPPRSPREERRAISAAKESPYARATGKRLSIAVRWISQGDLPRFLLRTQILTSRDYGSGLGRLRQSAVDDLHVAHHP
jgi:hypothetical protein